MLFSGNAQVEEPQLQLKIAPLNPQFIAWQQDKLKTQAKGYYAFGYIPELIDWSHLHDIALQKENLRGKEGAPPSYDLRYYDRMSPVQDQGACGSCWAFATMGSLESCLLTNPGETWDFSENNLKNNKLWDWLPCDGGNSTISTAYLTRWAGPVTEACDPYLPSPPPPNPSCPTQKYITEVRRFTEPAEIKDAIMAVGALHTSMFADQGSYDSETYTYYYTGGASTNHAVTIAGWDDEKVVPDAPGNGAWLIKNSWGLSPPWLGDPDGYFWVSYFDEAAVKLAEAFCGTVPTSTYSTNYMYDPLGAVSNYGNVNDFTYYGANIFTPLADEDLCAVGFYANADNTSYEIYIYDDFDGTSFSNQLGTTTTGSVTDAGYYTITLDTRVSLTTGDDFGIVVKVVTPGYKYPLAIEYPLSGYTSGATANLGESFVSHEGVVYSDLADMYANTNVCIKGLTVSNNPPELGPIGNKSVDEGQTLTFTVTASDPDPGDVLTISADNLPVGSTFDPVSGVFNWETDYDDAGPYIDITFTVTDDGSPPLSDDETIQITVDNVTYTVNVSAGTGGLVSPSGDQIVDPVNPFLVTANPDTCFRFVDWTVTGGVSITDGDATGEFEVTDNGNITANFAKEIIKGPYLQMVTSSSMVIMWETDNALDSRVDYGQSMPGPAFKDDASLVKIHEIQLTGLTPDAEYYYTVTSNGTTSATYTFSTAPATERNFRFVAYGDNRTNTSIHYNVIQGIITNAPEFVLNTGDLVYHGNVYSEWGPQFFDPAHDLMVNTPLLPVLGNHEYGGGSAPWFKEFFSLSEESDDEWFAFSYSNARFIGLNTNVDYSPSSDQYNWLLTELQSSEYTNATWHFVYFHHPPYTSTMSHIDDEGVKEHLVPLFEQYGVDMVFNGHSHVYERYHHNDIHYIVTGGGGAPLTSWRPDNKAPYRVEGWLEYHYCIIDVFDDHCDFVVRKIDGSVIDEITFYKHTVTFIAGSNGSITGNTIQKVKHGANCTEVEAVPDENYLFNGWTGDYTGTENPLTVTNVVADMTITANFAKQCSISISGLSGGSDVYIHATNGWQGTKKLDGNGIISGLLPGVHILQVQEQGKRTELVSVSVSAGANTNVTISLKDAIPFVFTDKTAVEDSDGYPIGPNIFNSSVMDDIDRDNDVDLVVAEADGDISYYIYDGGFVLSGSDDITLGDGENIVCIRCADLNADGNRELIIGLNTGKIFLFNIGNKTESAFYTAGSDLTGFDIIENNGDDDPDLLLGYTNGTIKMELSDGSGSWNGAQGITLGGSPLDIGDNATPLAMDLDGDGVKDLIVGNQDGDVQWFKGNGTLEYTERGSVNSGGMPLAASGSTALSMGYNTTMNELPYIIVTDADGNVYQSHAILLGDVDDDGKVFINDLSIFVEFWGLDDNNPGWNADVNFEVTPNGSGYQEINISDFTLFNDSWRREE